MGKDFKSTAEILFDDRDYKPKTSPSAMEEFIQGTLHADFQNELAVRVEQLRDFYEDCPQNQYLETKGAIKAIRLISTIFLDMLENRKSDLESERGEANV